MAITPTYKSTDGGLPAGVDVAGSGAIPMNCVAPPPSTAPTTVPTSAPTVPGPAPSPTPGGCLPSKAASAWTTPGGKVAPYKAFRHVMCVCVCVSDEKLNNRCRPQLNCLDPPFVIHSAS